MTGTAQDLINEARKSLGTKETPAGSNYNYIVRWYNENVDSIGNGPWCDMSVTMWGAKSGNGNVVGEYAYTVWHAQWFLRRGQWHSGTKGIRAGDVIFFDWRRSRAIENIDHVGIVERVEGDKIYTIEGNINDVCKRVVRDSTYVVGYGRPAYTPPALVAPSGSQILKLGSTGDRVRVLQRALNKVSTAGLDVDGDFGPKTKSALKSFQRKAGFKLDDIDGEYGPQTAKALKTALGKLV